VDNFLELSGACGIRVGRPRCPSRAYGISRGESIDAVYEGTVAARDRAATRWNPRSHGGVLREPVRQRRPATIGVSTGSPQVPPRESTCTRAAKAQPPGCASRRPVCFSEPPFGASAAVRPTVQSRSLQRVRLCFGLVECLWLDPWRDRQAVLARTPRHSRPAGNLS
jgi:hypothetical protein